MSTELGTISTFFKDSNLVAKYKKVDAVVQALDENVEAGAYELEDLDFDRGERIDVFGQPVQLDARFKATLKTLAVAAEVPLDDIDAILETPEGFVYTDFGMSAGLAASAEQDLTFGALTAELTAGAGAEFAYRHLLPIRHGRKRLKAFEETVRSSRLPGALDVSPDEFFPGEIQQYSKKFHLTFGLKLSGGWTFKIDEVVHLFTDLAIKADIQAAVEASLGLGFYDDTDLLVARIADADWIRLRLARRRKSELSLGARVAIQADYDLGGTSLISILDEVLGTDPAREILVALAEVRQFTTAAGDGNWDEIKNKISKRAGQALSEFIDKQTGWKEWLNGSEEVTEILELSKEVVDAYQNADSTIRSWWSDLLGEVSLGEDSKLIKALEAIKQIDPDNFDLTDLEGLEGLEESIQLIESLTGQDLEELIFSSAPELREALTRARDLATKALDLVGKVPAQLSDKFHEFSKKIGLDKAIEFIARFDSKSKLEDAATQRILDLAARLVGKAWDQISNQDFNKIQKAAARIDSYLRKIQDAPDQIREALGKLKGEFGFSLALGFERMTENTAILDVEFDPSDGSMIASVEEGLKKCNVTKLLTGMIDPEDKASGAEREPLPFRIRESIFTRKRVTTGSLSLFTSLFGNKEAISRRIEEDIVRIVGGARQGTYSGGFERILSHDSCSCQAGVWLEAGVASPDPDPRRPFDSLSSLALRWAVAKTTAFTSQEEVGALQGLLEDYQFDGPKKIMDVVPKRDGIQTRFSLSLDLAESAAELVLGAATKSAWWGDYAEAAEHWVNSPLTFSLMVDGGPAKVKDALAKFIMMPVFQAMEPADLIAPAGPGAMSEFEKWSGNSFDVGPDKVPVRPRQVAPQLRSYLIRRAAGFKKQEKHVEAWVQSQGDLAPADLRSWTAAASRAFRSASTGRVELGNPMFIIWLTRERIKRNAGHKATGIATFRWRENNSEKWSAPMVWKCDSQSFE